MIYNNHIKQRTMTKVKYLICTIIALGMVACSDFVDDTKVFQRLDSLQNTTWYNFDTINKVYYDIEYSDVEDSEEAGWYEGSMKGYSNAERTEIIEELCEDFIYTFIPAQLDKNLEAVVRVKFDNGKLYGGEVIPKGALQISSKDVYIIQLYETDDSWNPIVTEDNTFQSTIMMWKE